MKRDISCEKLVLDFYNRPVENMPKVELQKEKSLHKIVVVISDEKKTTVFALRSS